MKNSISQSEKLDIFLALASFYEVKPVAENNAEPESTKFEMTLQTLSALGDDELLQLRARAKRFESLSKEKQKAWQKFWLEKLRQRGQTTRLDERIHPDIIVRFLKDEPKIIQQLIYENLPDNLAKKVSVKLPEIVDKKNQILDLQAQNEETSKIIRDKYLSNFIAYEDLYQPTPIDELTYEQIEKLIWKLGIRETAISCRGIKTKENLAVFLKPFGAETTKEIARKIAELESIDPSRVIYAEKFVNDCFESESNVSERITTLGLKLLSMTQCFCDSNTKQFTIQKFPIKVGNKLSEYVEELEMQDEDSFEVVKMEIEDLAVELKEAK